MTEFDLEYEPILAGLPVIVRLMTGDEFMCIAFKPRDEKNPTILVYRPTVISLDTRITEAKSGDNGPLVKARFSRWVPLSSDDKFTLYADSIIVLAALDPMFVKMFYEWSAKIYNYANSNDYPDTDNEVTPNLLSNTSSSALSVSDILLNFKPKGRPN